MSIQIQQVSVKIPFVSAEGLDLDAFIPIFHEWIREKRITEELLIDVADYRHVPDGPGVMLIANEAHYGIDSDDGIAGLVFSRRRDELGDAEAAVRLALSRAASAARHIEAEESLGGGLRFDTGAIAVRVLSRLTAPNTDETHAALAPVVGKVLEDLGWQGAELAREGDTRRPYGLTVKSAAKAPDLSAL